MPDWLMPAAVFASSLINIAFTASIARSRASKEVTDALQRQISALSDRLTRAEEAAKHAPTAETLNQLAQNLGKLHGDLRELSGEFRAVRHQVSNIDEFLRNKA
jgi:predicted  nucleic acid-binding Zn-ribbon protein